MKFAAILRQFSVSLQLVSVPAIQKLELVAIMPHRLTRQTF